MSRIIKRENVQVGGDPSRPAHPQSFDGAASSPGVRLIRVDGRVHSIEHTCRCGEVAILEIEYESSAADPRTGQRGPEASQ